MTVSKGFNLLAILALLGTLFALPACAAKNQYDGLRGVPIEKVTKAADARRPKLGLAFGGGGVRGLSIWG
jgi:hypothetical protein